MSADRPTFHESWYRVAPLCPRLRTTVQTRRQHFRGRRWHVVDDPANNHHFRLDDAGYDFLGLLDGRRTVEEAWRICNDRLGDLAPTQGEVINLLGQLHSSNLLQSGLPPDAARMVENARRRTEREVAGVISNLMFLRAPLFDPDRLLERWERVLGPLFGRTGFAVWLVLLAAAVVVLVGRFDELFGGFGGVLAPENVFLLYLSFAGVKAVHELGHGLACKRIGRLTGTGGAVHTIGVAMLVFTPVPYVDASSSWAFRSKWHRAFVGAAGMYVELAVASVAAIVWANSSPGVVHALAYNTMFVASVSTLLFNANPLLRFDGYYILSDLLEAPNLARRSRDHLLAIIRRRALGVQNAVSPVSGDGERWWLPVYAIASAVYKVVVCVGIIFFVSDRLFFIGSLLAAGAIVAWLIVPLGRMVRYLIADPELARCRKRALAVSGAAAAIVVIAVGAVPVPDRGRAEGVVEPEHVALVYTIVEGFVEDVRSSGVAVERGGDSLITARNLELETKRATMLAERRLTEIERGRAGVEEIALAQSLDQRLAALDEQIRMIDRRLAALSLRPAVDGIWLAPDVEHLRGAFLERGAQVGVVASIDRLLVRAVADQHLGPRIAPEIGVGGPVEIRVRGRPDIEFGGRVREVLPAGSRQLPSAALGYTAGGSVQVARGDESGRTALEPFFEIQVELDETLAPAARLCSGQRVVVRFEMPPRPLAVQWWQDLRRLVQRRFQI